MKTKAELRSFYRNIRATIPEDEYAEKSREICLSVLNCKEYSDSELVLAFIPVKGEPDILPVIKDALSRGKTVAIPDVDGKNMSFLKITSTDFLVMGKYGIPTSSDTENKTENFDNCFCLVPALSVDRTLYRLGYGGGYYDRFLSKNPDIFSAAVCFDACVCNELPADKCDVKINLCITERESFGGVINA